MHSSVNSSPRKKNNNQIHTTYPMKSTISMLLNYLTVLILLITAITAVFVEM